jgi:hypothetical protein
MTEPVDRPRQSRIKRPTAKLTDLNNLQQPALSFQRAAVEAERVRLQQDVDPPSQPNSSLPPSSPFAASTGSTRPTSPIVTERSSEQPASAGGKRPFVLSDDEFDDRTKRCKRGKPSVILTDDEEYEKSESSKQTKGNPRANSEYRGSLQSQTFAYILAIATNEDGMYHDVTVLDIGDEPEKKLDPTADVKQFFDEPFSLEGHGKRKRRFCKICKYVSQMFDLDVLPHRSIENATQAPQVGLGTTAHHFDDTCKLFIG